MITREDAQHSGSNLTAGKPISERHFMKKLIDKIYDSIGSCSNCDHISIEEYEEGNIYFCQANDFEIEQPETFFCKEFVERKNG